ncbi:ABC transporter ATP-binding protein [Aliarcobacter butzleri]|uniref:ABC transporter ATP-binding protein n=1 Tax=Aliarcobacter butzleri TaxID=28197 RepID=UPI001EDA7EAC|nr:ABC transporter ATP-binding protein [Aliarcobacter butzleri]MCG3652941.1 ABC transporter ATP-binding protein/permease [Aliarcobacter butzleri]MDN5072230.1 ABC transporter ATP-binding protein [Aliarcobacter butzleri]MDN5120879.1 ABC transporter ATP-binding protein [Aliarcobacter butzleri]MDN5129023.1 ABC transporter ATP-binding protein [Aliarcobacter butzleri]
MKKQKVGLWAIMSPVKFKIRLAMLLASIGAISLISSLLLLSLTLSNILINTPLIIFGIELDLIKTILLLAILTIIAFVSRLAGFIVSHLGAFHLEQILRINLSQHLATVPLGYIISNGSGTLKKVMQDDVKTLHTFVADSTPMIAKSIVAPISTLIILLIIDYRFALATLSVFILGWITMAFSMRDSKTLRIKYEKSQSNINKAVIEFAQAMPVVRTFDDGTTSFKRYNDALLEYKTNLQHWMNISAFSAKLGMIILSPLPTLIAVLITGIYLLNFGTLELFAFISALFLSTGMADAMMPLMWINNHIKKSQASALRIQEVLEIKSLEIPKETKSIKTYDIEFENVSFKYDSVEKYALKNISFKAKEGSVTALVGPSGAGKSTVAKLIPRFWDVTSGEIKIGDVNIKELSSETLMNTVSFVFQDTFLFQDTIYNNIKMANEKATKEDIVNACKAAQIHDFIESLPDGYETLAGDRGTNLSGGQKQRITIARAILRNTPIIVLDEATAFADPENEEEIVKALANLTINKTVIMIAHRLSTIKDSDQIIVFDEGKISEIGKHDELLEKQGIYSKLWSNYEKASSWNLEKIEDKKGKNNE